MSLPSPSRERQVLMPPWGVCVCKKMDGHPQDALLFSSFLLFFFSRHNEICLSPITPLTLPFYPASPCLHPERPPTLFTIHYPLFSGDDYYPGAGSVDSPPPEARDRWQAGGMVREGHIIFHLGLILLGRVFLFFQSICMLLRAGWSLGLDCRSRSSFLWAYLMTVVAQSAKRG